jgi:hypothetical protein
MIERIHAYLYKILFKTSEEYRSFWCIVIYRRIILKW